MTTVDRLSGINSGLSIKAPVRAASTAAGVVHSGLQTIDGVALADGDRFFDKDNANAVLRGIYNVSSGTWERAKDFDGPRDAIRGTTVIIAEGTVNAGDEYMLMTSSPDIGTSSLDFSLRNFANLGYVPVNKAGDVSSLALSTTVTDQTPAFWQWNMGENRTALAGSERVGHLITWSMQGGRGNATALSVFANTSGAFSADTVGKYATAIFGHFDVLANSGGTLGAEQGYYYGIGGFIAGRAPNYAGLGYSGATRIQALTNELDVLAETGTSVIVKSCLTLASGGEGLGNDQVQGSLHDGLLALTSDHASNVGVKVGISIGREDSYPPVSVTGTMMKVAVPISGTVTAAYGIDLSNATFTTSAFKSNGFAVSGTGIITSGGSTVVNASASYAALESAGGTGFRWITSSGTFLLQRTTDGFGSATNPLTVDASDNAVFTKAVVSSSALSGIGYSAGSGGTVTQITSKATGVTLNKINGQVTMNNAALAAGAKVTFTVTNSSVAATDGVLAWVVSGGTANAYRADATAVAAGSFALTVENITAGSLSEAPVIGFMVLRSVNA